MVKAYAGLTFQYSPVSEAAPAGVHRVILFRPGPIFISIHGISLARSIHDGQPMVFRR